MEILTADIGTGTQDIYLFRSGASLENGLKMVMPSPTMIIRKKILEATRKQEAILLTGLMMGGGPCHWAAEAHIHQGLPLYATPEAARTFNDDINWVQDEMGVRIVSPDEARRLKSVTEIQLRDFHLETIASAFDPFGIKLQPQVIAVAVFDHGAAPPGVSDRQFRFDYLRERIQHENRLTTFAYHAEQVPRIMTRMLAVVESAKDLDCPLMLMDTAAAAVLGATLDQYVRTRERLLIANVGNFHTLAFRLGPAGIEGLFEHHTGLLEPSGLDRLLLSLANGSLSHQEVFEDHGHGALLLDDKPMELNMEEFSVVVTGPRRQMMMGSQLRTHFAAPFGDMMLTGCFGLLLAVGERLPQFAEPIRDAMSGAHASQAPWDAKQ